MSDPVKFVSAEANRKEIIRAVYYGILSRVRSTVFSLRSDRSNRVIIERLYGRALHRISTTTGSEARVSNCS